MPLTIPEEHHAAIAKIIDLPDTSIDELISAISTVKIKSNPLEMTEAIRARVPSISDDDLLEIVETLYALYHVREFSEARPARFVSDIVETIQNTLPNSGPLSATEIGRLRKRFKALLDISTLNGLAKALKLQRDGERIYCDSKIVSDIRPVFGEDVSEPPSSAVIRHTLGLSYHEDGNHREFYVVLDEADLRSLSTVIERALVKSETLTEFLNKSDTSRLGI